VASIDTLVARLGLLFRDASLLEGALTHRSYAHENPMETHHLANSERLEFLGDSVLNYIAADLVFQRFPDANEGELTATRSALIKTHTLAGFARDLDLGRYLRLNKGEDHSGARNRNALLADTFEAVLAAIYLDAGMDATRTFLLPFLERELATVQTHGRHVDHKTRLQERIQAERNITPHYLVMAASGPDHQREWMVEVRAGDEQLGVGRGSSKQAATQEAARAALEGLAE
jgi:ribonuclease-3